MTTTFEKTPEGILDYSIDYTNWLASGASIASSVWTLDPPLNPESFAFSPTQTSVFISGGVDGETYCATNTVTDDRLPQPATTSRSFKIKIKAKRFI